MHTATLDRSDFSIELRGEPAGVAELLPGWHAHDRFGIVVHEPFGALGASHLIQAAITAFYDVLPDRRAALRQYPDMYLFHVGGPHGDHSTFDFWPPRKEVRTENDPIAVLGAINDHAITRLAVPEGRPVPVEFAGLVSAGWAERNGALERITTAFAYSAGGRVSDPDVTIAGLKGETEGNGAAALDPAGTVAAYSGLSSEDFAAYWPNAEFDTEGWLEVFGRRADEQPAEVRNRVAERRQGLLVNGAATESYRRISVDEALGRLV